MSEAAPGRDPVYVDSVELEKKLVAVAWRKFRALGCPDIDSILPGTGKTARGLAHDTIVKLLKSGKWEPGKNGREVFGYALTILNNLFVDLLRSADRKTTAVMDPGELDNITSSKSEDPESKLLREERFEKIKRSLGKDVDGKAYLDAVSEGARTRDEIAEKMGKSPEEVTTIQKRLQYKLKKMEELFEE